MSNNNLNVYIKNMEAAHIYKNNEQGTPVKIEYTGMFPYSLELLKLESIGFKTKKYKGYGKTISDDIINVQFNYGYKKDPEDKALTLTNEALREELYTNGFTLNGEHFVMYKRSSAKSRIGNCLFIKKKFYSKMIKWSRMGLKIAKNTKMDVVGLSAYSSLVSSALENITTINPDHILIIDDIENTFKVAAKEVKTGEDGYLHSYINNEAEITNCFTDGSSLLDAKYFDNNKSMQLLRQHMFKSAAFNTNIQLFLKDYCSSHNINYDTYEITDMFGNKIKAKDIELICTPNSLKAFKFSKFVGTGTKKEMFDYWKQKVKEDNCIFGICKHEKITKHKLNNKSYQQMSYQMVNSLPLNSQNLKDILKHEFEYIDLLKNDTETFLNYILKEANDMNSNNMLYEIAKKNNDFVNTKLFKDFRKDTIKNYIRKLKKGKVKLEGDYCVLISNPFEYLQAIVGEYNEDNLSLNDNEIYTKLFNDNEELVCFRNPHTSPANVYLARNKYVEVIDRYFNFNKNIVAVNCVKNEICDILSGCDWDSDTAVIFNDSTLVEAAKKCYRVYNVCLNKIDSNKNIYALNNKEMADIDNKLARSKNIIGQVVNLGQLAMSTYWNNINNNIEDNTQDLLEVVDVMTVLSGVAIDNAKKNYNIDMDKEIKHIKNSKLISKIKPNFWRNISLNSSIETMYYKTPMDLLSNVIDENVKRAKTVSSISLETLLTEDIDYKKANRKQIKKVCEEIESMKLNIGAIQNNIKSVAKEDRPKLYNAIDDIIVEEKHKIKQRKIKKETIYNVLLLIAKNKDELISKTKISLMNMFFTTNQEMFVSIFNRK